MKLYNELAEYYFRIEENHRDIDNDISLIQSILRGKESPTILDLGCGTGEHLDRLRNHGTRCVGIDSSEAMLQIARTRFPEGITFIKSDMLDFDFYNEFDAVISLFGSFNYMIQDSDVSKVLWNTWRALKAKGEALFEIWNSVPIERIREKSITPVSSTEFDDIRIERERGFKLLLYPNKTVVEVNYRYTIITEKGIKTFSDRHLMRTFSTKEIQKQLEENGFSIKEIYSNFSKDIYQDFSNRMIVHCKKS